jgi:hypothetical protein
MIAKRAAGWQHWAIPLILGLFLFKLFRLAGYHEP